MRCGRKVGSEGGRQRESRAEETGERAGTSGELGGWLAGSGCALDKDDCEVWIRERRASGLEEVVV